jgi:hypothetical protein
VTVKGRFTGQVGTVIAVADWVFSPDVALNYVVDLDTGFTVTCDPEDIETEKEEESND